MMYIISFLIFSLTQLQLKFKKLFSSYSTSKSERYWFFSFSPLNGYELKKSDSFSCLMLQIFNLFSEEL